MAGKRKGLRGGPRARLVPYGTRPIGIRWRLGPRKGEVSSETYDRDDALGARAVLIDQLKRGIIPKNESSGPGITWPAFRQRYQEEHVLTLSDASRSAWETSANWLESLVDPRMLLDLDKSALSQFRGKLLKSKQRRRQKNKDGTITYVEIDKPLSPNSAATYLRTIRAALGWAYDMDLLKHVPPRLRIRKGMKRDQGMRSRPICGEELDTIVACAVKVRPKDAPAWERFINGLSLSTLRIDELRRLSWDPGAELSIDATGRYPMIRMFAEGHKSGNDCYQPISPAFWELLTQRGVSQTGYAFQLRGWRGQQMSRKRVIRIVSDIGKYAGIITNASKGKTATSHDIGRRASLTKYSETLSMSQTQALARHSDPRTTSTYYIRHDAEKLAEAIGWNGLQNGLQSPHGQTRGSEQENSKV